MKIAAFTIVKNENTFLPIWLKYYQGVADYVLVLDNDTDDGSTDNLSVDVRKVSCGKSFNHVWLRDTVSSVQKELLEEYDVVIFAEVDEFIVHEELPLREAVEKNNFHWAIRCDGYDVFPKEDESKLDFTKPILSQRTQMAVADNMTKTLICKVPATYTVGFHRCAYEPLINKKFLLLHLHRVDYDYSWNKTLERAKYNWNERDVTDNLAWHNRITKKEEFDDWYYRTGKKFPIPSSIIERCLF